MDAIEVQQLVRAHRFLTPKKGAKLIGMNVRFLYKRIGKEGGPPYRKRGRYYQFPTLEFIMWSEQPELP